MPKGLFEKFSTHSSRFRPYPSYIARHLPTQRPQPTCPHPATSLLPHLSTFPQTSCRYRRPHLPTASPPPTYPLAPTYLSHCSYLLPSVLNSFSFSDMFVLVIACAGYILPARLFRKSVHYLNFDPALFEH